MDTQKSAGGRVTRDADIYRPEFVRELFDRCGSNYRWWSTAASFGFTRRWRRQCVAGLPPMPQARNAGLDLMAGTGEVWPHLLELRPEVATITAVDISSEMNRRALTRLHQGLEGRVRLIEADVLRADLPANSADFAISTFGMKTFDAGQHAAFARELARVLKPGGVFSIIEASDPKGWALHGLYSFYMNRVLPMIERTVLRGAQDFSMIGTYTRNFGDCRHLAHCLKVEGLDAEFKSYFFGCATGVVGRKPTP
jgi:ubiquinone/menaquinone biosynthesis C-methylase UbiE